MGKFNDSIKKIIYVFEEYEDDLVEAVKAYRRAKRVMNLTENVYDYVKRHLKDNGIPHNETNSSLNSIPLNYSSYHEDDYGNDQHNNH
jgi:uncharacterized protein involved in type VI secretion and phage assembly